MELGRAPEAKNSVNYLRLSVTDRCNLRCIYCVPKGGTPLVPHSEVLTYEEMLRIVKIAVGMGIKKVRITGGEPLLRKGIVWFIRELNSIEGLEKITLTTNGVLLKELATPLKEAGLKGINISLDSLSSDTFKAITGYDLKDKVMEGIQACEEVGIAPIKLNSVIIRGVNDNEIINLALLTIQRAWHVRFIEFMPVSYGVLWSKERVVGHQEIYKSLLDYFGTLEEVPRESLGGPARCFRLPGAKGIVGLISPMTHSFCDQCNRIRITARGGLKTCLFSSTEIPLIGLLRADRSDEEIAKVLFEAIKNKAKDKTGPLKGHGANDYMSQIGG